MSPAMKKETKSQSDKIAKPILAYVNFLATEPKGGLRLVTNDFTVASHQMLEQGKTDLLSSLQQTRETHLELHSHLDLLAADRALDATLEVATAALQLAARAASARKARRSSLVPTLNSIQGPSAETKDEDFTNWYENLFDEGSGDTVAVSVAEEDDDNTEGSKT